MKEKRKKGKRKREGTRTEIPPHEVFVELCSFENVTYELAYTVDVSAHGARVMTKTRAIQ